MMVAVGMSGPPRDTDDRFRPLRPAHGARFAAAIILGPLAWLVAFMVVGWLADKTDVIAVFLFITLCSFPIALVVLLLFRGGRELERRRYDGG